MTGAALDPLLDYCTSQPGLVLVPIEWLSEQGLDSEAAAAYQARNVFSLAECERIDGTVRTYCERAGKLWRASRQWFPPRVQHLCLITDGVRTRPYFQPFHASSWLLYRDDIAEDSSSLEFSIFLLFQVERQYMQQQVGASLLTNLPYLLILNEAQLEDFLAGCRRSTRPDADGYRALADALPAIRRMHHRQFRPLTARPPADHRVLDNGLIVGSAEQGVLDGLHRRWMRAVESVVAAHRVSSGASNDRSGRDLLAWLDERSPRLVLVGEEAELLWHGPGTTHEQREKLAALLARTPPEAEASIRRDLEVIDRKSRSFLDSLVEPDALAKPAAWMTEGGLSYIHGDTLRIAYSLTDDPDRLQHPSPPFERLMLAARTVHEWGHQAAESGWVRVDPDRLGERASLERALVELLDGMVDRLPGAMRSAMVAALGKPGDSATSPGGRMLQGLLRRIDDYMANLLARHYLTQGEMDTYVRNNVGSRLLDYAPEQGLTHLLRLAYEFQYLGLSSIDDPEAWFMKSTWFDALFATPGVCSKASFLRLSEQVGRICDCYEIDVQRIRLPSPPS